MFFLHTYLLCSIVLVRLDELIDLVEVRVLRILELTKVQGYFDEQEGE
jgi:hypothetical protein